MNEGVRQFSILNNEEFKIFNGYLIGNKGTIFNKRLKKVNGKDVIKINNVSYRRDSLIKNIWFPEPKEKPKPVKKIKYSVYKDRVKKLTNMQPLHIMKDFEKREFRKWDVDHIISVKYCWKNNIKEEECANIKNLQMITHEDNYIKRSQCYCVISQCDHLKNLYF